VRANLPSPAAAGFAKAGPRARIALRPYGRAAALAGLLGPALALTARLAARRHPDLFERLAAIPDPTFALVPDELPVAVIVRADTRRPRMRAVAKRDLDPARVATVVRGPLSRLAALADGRLDGDALFFSREIAIEGSTEAAVALRNALDNAALGGLAELVLPPGRAAKLVQRLLRLGGGVLEKLHAQSTPRRDGP
jgi:predicted lipid carrier protein YhbT